MLNGAIMDGLAIIHPLGTSIGHGNPSQALLVSTLDDAAKRVTSFIKDVYEVHVN